MMSPKVTVLMSVYNGERFLREAIESILTQTFTDFEFLIIDDGSTDATAQILSEYAGQDARIRIVTNETNIGLTKSLNKGIDLAKGEYIARMDADDVSLPERLEKQYRFFKNYPEYTVIGTWGEIINEKDEIIGMLQPEFTFETILSNTFWGCRLVHPSTFYRKKQIRLIHGYNETLAATQDYDLWLRIIAQGWKIANLPEILIQYRIHEKSISVSRNVFQEEVAYQVIQSALTNIFNITLSLKSIKLLREAAHFERKNFLRSEKINILINLERFWIRFKRRYAYDIEIKKTMKQRIHKILCSIVGNPIYQKILKQAF